MILVGCCDDGGQGEGGGEGGLDPLTNTGSWKSYAATYVYSSVNATSKIHAIYIRYVGGYDAVEIMIMQCVL